MAPAALVASTKTSACAATSGAVVSCTVTEKVPPAVLLSRSVALKVTGVVPRAKVVPLFEE